jgi:hypothetical protein
MSQNQPFEVPRELRQLAEQNVERARQLYLQFIEGVAQTMAVWAAPVFDSISPGFNRVRARAVKFAKENADAAFKLAREIAKAKDIQELLNLQSRYVQSQMRWYADQTQESGQLMTGEVADAREATQGLEALSSVSAQSPGKETAEETTNLKLISFSIEVKTDPVTLTMQTDKGPFNVEIPKTELTNLVYALQVVSYADEPLRKKQLKRQGEARQLNASAGNPNEKKEITLSMMRPSRTNEGKGRKKAK